MPVDNTSSLDQHTIASFQDKCLSDFITSAQEADALAELKTCLFEKVAVNSKKAQNQYPNYFSVTRANHTKKSEASAWKGWHLMRTRGLLESL